MGRVVDSATASDIALRPLPVFVAEAAADRKPRATFFTCHRAPCPDHSPRALLVGKFRDRQSGKEFLFVVNHIYWEAKVGGRIRRGS